MSIPFKSPGDPLRAVEVNEMAKACGLQGTDLDGRQSFSAPGDEGYDGTVPVVNMSTMMIPVGGIVELAESYDRGFYIMAYRPRRDGLSSIGIAAVPIHPGQPGSVYALSGTIVMSDVLRPLMVPLRDRIGCRRDSFVGGANPLGRILVRGYDANNVIVEITDPVVDRKLVKLTTGKIVSVREIEVGQEYTITVTDAGIPQWGLA